MAAHTSKYIKAEELSNQITKTKSSSWSLLTSYAEELVASLAGHPLIHLPKLLLFFCKDYFLKRTQGKAMGNDRNWPKKARTTYLTLAQTAHQQPWPKDGCVSITKVMNCKFYVVYRSTSECPFWLLLEQIPYGHISNERCHQYLPHRCSFLNVKNGSFAPLCKTFSFLLLFPIENQKK